MIRTAIVLTVLCGAATNALAQADPAKKATFISVLKRHDCQLHNFAPGEAVLADLDANGLDFDDVRSVGMELLATGDAVREGDVLVLKTGACR